MTYRTTAVYLSGAICGGLWAPLADGGRPINIGLRSPFNRIDQASFRDVLDLILAEEGGDFRGPSFTADTVVRIERRRIDGPGKYTVHVKELPLDKIGCADLVDANAFASDFFGED